MTETGRVLPFSNGGHRFDVVNELLERIAKSSCRTRFQFASGSLKTEKQAIGVDYVFAVGKLRAVNCCAGPAAEGLDLRALRTRFGSSKGNFLPCVSRKSIGHNPQGPA